MAKAKETKPLCVDGTLAHHMIVSSPEYHYVGSIETGKLMETTSQHCKRCPYVKTNECVVIIDEND